MVTITVQAKWDQKNVVIIIIIMMMIFFLEKKKKCKLKMVFHRKLPLRYEIMSPYNHPVTYEKGVKHRLHLLDPMPLQ